MRISRKTRILNEVTDRYLASTDFNGTPIRQLSKQMSIRWADFSRITGELIRDQKLRILYSDTELNTHIIRLGFESIESQLARLSSADVHACAYPTPEHLTEVVDRSKYDGRPYTLSLALGTPQLSYKAVDLSVLEFYRNDPRYEYVTDDIHGRISLTTDYYESQDMRNSDRIFLSSFGFCYDDSLNRAVAVYTRYISDLSPEHQQIWKAKELSGHYKLHPDYYRNTIIGDWGERIPIFDAFLQELQLINKMCRVMGRPDLFRNDFVGQDKPVEFSFLVRPTLKEYNDFVLLLDKIMSDNINKDFFANDVSYEYDEIRADGKVVVSYKNTITLLEEWIRSRFRTTDWEPIDAMIKAFRGVRKQRQNPAHKISENVFDQQYIHQQRELISDAYDAIRTIRLMFSNHPKCRDIPISPDLYEGKIWSF